MNTAPILAAARPHLSKMGLPMKPAAPDVLTARINRIAPPEHAANLLLLAATSHALETLTARLPTLNGGLGKAIRAVVNTSTNLLTVLSGAFDEQAHQGHAELGERALSAATVALHLPDDELAEWLKDGVNRALRAAGHAPATGLES